MPIDERGADTLSNQNARFIDFDVINVNNIRIAPQEGFRGVTKPVTRWLEGTTAQTAANYTTLFFIADRSYEVLSVTERHETAGSDGGAVTVMLKKVPSGTAPASGTDVLTGGISLKATANTNQNGTISQLRTNSVYNRRLSSGDGLSLVTTGTLTAVTGVTVSVLLRAL